MSFNSFDISARLFQGFVLGFALTACASHPPLPGPDQQFIGTVQGAATGAGAGAITGAQVAAGTGPGALVGAGVGAVAGAIHGAMDDRAELNWLALDEATERERERLYAQRVLREQYERRVELHPTRELYPADLFFSNDAAKLSYSGQLIVSELAALNRARSPWSRLVVAVYIKSRDPESEFAKHLADRRARAIVNAFVQAGLEPRRLRARAVVVREAVLIDANDSADRYSQAVELIPIDR